MNKRGFTLIELMIVVIIIGLLASVAIPRFLDYARSSREAEAKPQLKQVYTLQYRYEAQHGAFAATIADLEGGAALATNGRYFEYSVAANGAGFCVVASPSAEGVDAGLDFQSIDASGDFHESPDCS